MPVDTKKPGGGIVPRVALSLAAAGAAVVGGLALFASRTARRAEAAVPADGVFVDVDGTRVHYLDHGAGSPIVLIHGLGGQMRNFGYGMLDRLARHHRVILVDRPGSGYSVGAPGLGANVRAQAAVVAGLIERLDLDRPLVVGHSLGGAVALALAIDHPARVGGLALISPLTQPLDTAPAIFRGLTIESPALRRLVAWTVATPIGLATGVRTARAVFAPEPAPEDFREAGGGMLTLRPANFYAASSDLVAANLDLPAMLERYRDLGMPVGILYGRDDAILDPALHGTRLTTQVPGATLTLIDGGHMIPVTQPDTVSDWVHDRALHISRATQIDAIGHR